MQTQALPIINNQEEILDYVSNLFPPFAGFNPKKHIWTNAHKQTRVNSSFVEKSLDPQTISQIQKSITTGAVEGFDFDNLKFTNGHKLIMYGYLPINIKHPTIFGDLLIRKIRHIGEHLWNDSYSASQSISDSYSNETKTYQYLNGKGFPTLTSMQDLLPEEYALSKKVVLTLYESNLENVATLLEQRNNSKRADLIEEVGHLLSWFNSVVDESRGEISYHGDPWTGNILKKKDEMYLVDFEFKTNPLMMMS